MGRRWNLRLGTVLGALAAGCALPSYETDARVDCVWFPDAPGCSGTFQGTGGGACGEIADGCCAPGSSVDPDCITATGGQSGTGGAPPNPPPVIASVDWIDDLDDGDLWIFERGGRRGNWYSVDDETPEGVLTMGLVNPGADGRGYAMRMAGSGFASWGPELGFLLRWDGADRLAYDASTYDGIVFSARIAEGSFFKFKLFVGTADTTDTFGRCTSCYDNYAAVFTATTEWQEFVFRFSELEQAGWGVPQVPALDTSSLVQVSFKAGVAATFDLSVDDIGFFVEQ